MPFFSQPYNPGTLEGPYIKLCYPRPSILLLSYKCWLLPLCCQAGFCSVGWAEHRWLEHLEPIRISLVKTPHGFPLRSDPFRILFFILWGFARSGLCLPLQPSLTFLWPTCLPDILTTQPFFQFFELPKPFPAVRFLYIPLSWLGLFFPPSLYPPDFRVQMKLSLLQRVFPLWPHPITPIHP